MAWCKIVMQHFLVVYHEYLGIHIRLKAHVYTEKIQVTRGIFDSIPLESVA